MKRLITVEEHYASPRIRETVNAIFRREGRDPPKQTLPPALLQRLGDLGDHRIAYMDAMGIDAQVVSYAGVFPAYLAPEHAIPLCREANDEMYAAAQAHPGRFYLLAHLPLSDPQAAAEELTRTVTQLSFKGAMFFGSYQGRFLEADYYFPIYQRAAALGVPLYLHPGPVAPPVREVYYTGPWSPQVTEAFATFGIGWHYEVGIQATRMILSGLFDRLPQLKILLGHWGEVAGYYPARMDDIPQAATGLKHQVSWYWKEHFYVNPSGICNAPQFRFCLDTFGPDHILWGQDYPYRMPENLRTLLEEFPMPEDQREAVAHGTAERLLGL